MPGRGLPYVFVSLLAGGLASASAAGASPRLAVEVGIPAPASGLVEVRVEIPAEAMAGRDHIDVGFAAARQLGAAVRRIEARSGARRLAVVEPDPERPYIKRVARPPGVGRTVLAYTIDPTYFPPGRLLKPGYANSRLTRGFGVLRTSALFPRFAAEDQLPADVTFQLPPDWAAVTPWNELRRRGGASTYRLTREEFAATDYVALGPFRTTQVHVGDSRIRVGTLDHAGTLPLETVVALVRRALGVVRLPLPGSGILSAIVVPPDFMSGGAAGDRTVVQPAWPEVLAHEIFHWWNDAGLTGEDAAWFREGLSEYYGIRIARGMGAFSDERARACLADMAAEVELLDGATPVGLRDASLAFTDDRARRLVYAKGALFGLVLERYLETHGRSIDEAVRAILASGRSALGSADIEQVFRRVYGGLTDGLFRKFVQNGAALPELSLPPATGASGCARYVRRR